GNRAVTLGDRAGVDRVVGEAPEVAPPGLDVLPAPSHGRFVEYSQLVVIREKAAEAVEVSSVDAFDEAHRDSNRGRGALVANVGRTHGGRGTEIVEPPEHGLLVRHPETDDRAGVGVVGANACRDGPIEVKPLFVLAPTGVAEPH